MDGALHHWTKILRADTEPAESEIGERSKLCVAGYPGMRFKTQAERIAVDGAGVLDTEHQFAQMFCEEERWCTATKMQRAEGYWGRQSAPSNCDACQSTTVG